MNNRKDIEQLKEQLEQMKISGELTSLDSILSTVERMEFSPLFKPYGLFFEEYKENEVEILNTHKLVPTQLDDLLIEKDLNKPVNLLLEGDNYQALKLLEKTHKEKIDVIYIDPPYNTGNKDFVYNDAYVNNEDDFRHSKWLSFMYKRLKLAKKLMSDDGVIFISIDDNEHSQLKLLCDKVFGEHNFVSDMVWQKKYTVSNDKNGISSQTEFILCYSKNQNKPKFNNEPLKETYVKKAYNNPDNDPRGPWRVVELFKNKNPYSYDVVSPTGKQWNKAWNYNKEGFKKLLENNLVFWGKDGKSCPRKKVFLYDSKGTKPINLLLGDIVGYTGTGSEDILEIFGDKSKFSYPKPTKLIKHLLKLSTKEDSVVLDFFAGSGTTGQAVMELNKEDGGNRTFILATNNEVSNDKELQLLISKGLVLQTPEVKKGQPFKEWKQSVAEFKETAAYAEFLLSEDYLNLGIARQVTYERLKRVINGYTTPKGKVVEGLPNNLKHIVLETVSNLDAKKGVYSQKDVVFFIENVMEDVDAEYFKGESKEKLVYVVGEEEIEDLLSELKENPSDKEVIIYTNIGVINQFKQQEKGFTFKKFPKL